MSETVTAFGDHVGCGGAALRLTALRSVMARNCLGPGEVQAVTFDDSAIQALGGRSLI